MTRGRILLAVGLFVLLVQAPARHGEFQDYDDNRFVVSNRHIDEVGNPLRFFTSLEVTTSAERPTRDIYRPLRTLAYAVLTAVFGKGSAAPFHWLSILFHMAAAVLLAVLLLDAGVAPWLAGLGAAAFGVHPVVVETTAWVCSLGDAMCGAFVLWSVLAHARDRTIQAFTALVLALFAKEHAVILPGLWFAWDFALRPQRLRAATWVRAVPALLVVVGFLVFRSTVLDAKMSQVEGPLGGTWPRAILTMLTGLGWYASSVLFPVGSTFYADVPVQYAVTAPALAGLAVLAVLGYGALRGDRLVRLGCLWFLVGLVPVSNLFVTLKIPTADRFLYLPLMGLAFVAVSAIRATRPLSIRVAPAVLVVLAMLCVSRIGDWKNDEALIGAWKEANPRHPLLVWKEGALLAKAAVAELQEGDLALGAAYADNAQAEYLKYFKNTQPQDQTEPRIEIADVLFAVGARAQRTSTGREWRQPWVTAFEHYAFAFRNQIAGRGRIIPSQMDHAADQLVRIGVPLAEPFSPELGKIMGVLKPVMEYRRARGLDDRYPYAQLLVASAITKRAGEPARARVWCEKVLAILGDLERDGTPREPLYFLRGQATLYRSILKDRPIDNEGLRNAMSLLERAFAWAHGAGYRVAALNARIQQAEAYRILAEHGGLDSLPERIELTRTAIALLRSLPEYVKKYRFPVPEVVRNRSQSVLSQAQALLKKLEKR